MERDTSCFSSDGDGTSSFTNIRVGDSKWSKSTEHNSSIRLTNATDEGVSRASNASYAKRGLSTRVENYILRGVPAVTLFESFGSAFAAHNFEANNYDKSLQVSHLNDFISHDWSSSRRDKFLTLCMIYNGFPAMSISICWAILLGVLQVVEVVPIPATLHDGQEITESYGYWCQLCCPLIFVSVLLWWQHLVAFVSRQLSRPLRFVFLDKYCIDQVDEERKQAGILGLAGFLRKTDRFVVCWTPRYFTRLWCTYEVATWLYLQKPLDQVLFMPLSHGKAAFFMSMAVGIYLVLYAGIVYFIGGQFYMFIALTTGILVVPFPVHKMRKFVHEIRQLPQQLKDFSVEKAECFCCSNKHVHPDDPSCLLPCDRLLVEQTIRGWFSEDIINTTLRESLGTFNQKVRALFGDFVLKQAGPTQLPYKYFLLYGWAFIFRGFDALAASRPSEGFSQEQTFQACFEFIILVLVIFPSSFKVMFCLIEVVDAAVGIPVRRSLNILVTLAVFPLVMLIFGVPWVAMTLSYDISFPVHLGTCFLEVLLACYLFRADISRTLRGCGRSSTPHKKAKAEEEPSTPQYQGELRVTTYGPRVSRVLRVEL